MGSMNPCETVGFTRFSPPFPTSMLWAIPASKAECNIRNIQDLMFFKVLQALIIKWFGNHLLYLAANYNGIGLLNNIRI